MSLQLLPKNSELEKALGCSVVHYKDAVKYGQACREQALEEAAQICRLLADCEENTTDYRNGAAWCAEKIRSLK